MQLLDENPCRCLPKPISQWDFSTRSKRNLLGAERLQLLKTLIIIHNDLIICMYTHLHIQTASRTMANRLQGSHHFSHHGSSKESMITTKKFRSRAWRSKNQYDDVKNSVDVLNFFAKVHWRMEIKLDKFPAAWLLWQDNLREPSWKGSGLLLHQS